MLCLACTTLKMWMRSYYKIKIFYINSTKFASLEKLKGLTVLGQHDPLVIIGWCWVATFPYNGVYGIQFATFLASPNCTAPDCVPHLHDLWFKEFLIPTITALIQEMLVHTKFTIEVPRWWHPLCRLSIVQSFSSLAKSHLWSSTSLSIE